MSIVLAASCASKAADYLLAFRPAVASAVGDDDNEEEDAT